MYTFVDITTLFSRRMSALVNSTEDLMILLTLKKNGNSFLKKIIKQEVLNRWFFVETKAILGRERRTVSDCGSHMHRLFQKLL